MTPSFLTKTRCNRGEHTAREDRQWQYKSMVTAMDKSIGDLLKAVKDLGVEDDTLIIFTSDNGPENGAGTAGPYRDGKRSLMVGHLYINIFVFFLLVSRITSFDSIPFNSIVI